ncbi:MAG TPA: CPBP family intramembrane glutamic endopeptidase [Thermoanaerobaculia bacterium]|nr:CPBP family intramembrane glutamic endopeptidase [Thermoanaerobaculia bacterium]
MRALAIPVLWALAMLATRFVDPLPVIVVVAVTMAAVVGWRERLTLRPLLRMTPRIAGLAVVAAAAMTLATYLIFPLLVRWIPQLGTETQIIYTRFLSHRALAVLIAGVVPVVIAEEVLWRGVFQGSLARAGVLAASVTYAAAHAPAGSLLLVALALVCGLYWSALRAISGSLIPSLCAHLVWDIALIVFPLSR